MPSLFIVSNTATVYFPVYLLLYFLSRLQMVLNSAARLILRVLRREHVTRHLQYLNWLPIRQRIDFKLAVLAYRCLCRCRNRPLPPPPLLKLLCSTLSFLPFSRLLYSPWECPAMRPALSISPFRTITHGDRAFSFEILFHPVSLLHPQFPLSVPVSRSIS
jgi:hypothetical protein